MNLPCICRTLGDIYGPWGLITRGLTERSCELRVDQLCPLHGDSPTAKAQRQAWRESVEERMV